MKYNLTGSHDGRMDSCGAPRRITSLEKTSNARDMRTRHGSSRNSIEKKTTSIKLFVCWRYCSSVSSDHTHTRSSYVRLQYHRSHRAWTLRRESSHYWRWFSSQNCPRRCNMRNRIPTYIKKMLLLELESKTGLRKM